MAKIVRRSALVETCAALLAQRSTEVSFFVLLMLVFRLFSRTPEGQWFRRLGCGGGAGYYFDVSGRMVVTDQALTKRLAHAAVHKSDQRYTYLFSGCYSNSILSSVESSWDKQRRIIHAFIKGRGPRFASITRAEATSILAGGGLADGIADPGPGGEGQGVVVDINRFIGDRVLSISRRSLGDDEGAGGALPGDTLAAVPHVERFIIANVICATTGLEWLLAPVLRRVAASVFRKTRHDQELRRYVKEAVAWSPFVRELVETCGEEETLGHLWVVTLGSSIPEMYMTVRIVESLAASQEMQREVHEMIKGDDLDSFKTNDRFASWVDAQCAKHLFFSASGKYLSKDLQVGDRTIRKGQDVIFRYDDMRDMCDATFPWGFGARACPGAMIGKDVVRSLVFATLRTYDLVATAPVRSLKTRDWGNLLRYSPVKLTPRRDWPGVAGH